MIPLLLLIIALALPTSFANLDVSISHSTFEAQSLLTQEQAIEIALEQNPDLKPLAHYLDGIRTSILQARSFPKTSIDFDFDQQAEFFHSDEIYYGFSQEVEFPTRLGLRSKLAAKEVNTAEIDFEQNRWELLISVKKIYQRLAFMQHSVDIARENLSIAERLADMAEQKYKLGSVGKLDVLRSNVEKASAADNLLNLESEEQSTKLYLNYLLGREPETALRTTTLQQGRVISEDLANLTALALKSRRELQAIRSRRSAAEIQRSLARSEFYPDFTFGFSRHRVAGEPSSWDVTASINIPLFGRGAINGRVAETKAIARGLDSEETAALVRIELEVRTAYAAADKLAERVNKYRSDILAQAEEAFRIAQASYREGEIESLELLESQRTLQEVKRGFAETVFAYNIALIDLEHALGSKINWETSSDVTPDNTNQGEQ
jgi:cobalt-zinc-cadmium efflux system outer membrane protein